MKMKSHLVKAAGLSLLISANLQAAPFTAQATTDLFSPAVGAEAAKAQASELVASKAYVEGAYLYNVNAKALNAKSKQLTISLAPGLTVYAGLEKTSKSQSGGLVWQGKASLSAKMEKSKGKFGDSVTLINRKGEITGTVRVDGRLFKIQPVGEGLHRVIEVNEDNMVPDHPHGAMEKMEQALTERLANETGPMLEAPKFDTKNANPVIRLLVLYTPGVASQVSDVPGMVDLAFAETNQGYVNSGVNATVELAHLAQTSYTATNISTDLGRLESTTDSYMPEAHTLRDQYGADVVMLLVPTTSYCGQAAGIGSNAASAFAVTAQNCATGYYSFGHELGHLQSARHNPENDPTTTPYAFGHGYQDPSSNWRTVMAYNCSSGCTRINWWSNPNNTRSGTPMGTSSQSDNTRVLNLTAATIAGFRGTGTPPPPSGATELQKGTALTGLSGSAGAEADFTFDVPAGSSNVTFNMSGGSGDGDLYVRFGAEPTTSTYDCRPYKNGNSESCTFATAQTGTYYAMIRGYSAYSGVSLVADYQGGSGSTGGSLNESNLSASTGNWLRYTANVGSGRPSLNVEISGGSGDADLYLRKGSAPSTSSYDCRPYKTGNSETCTVTSPGADTYHIGIRAYSAFSGVSLSASW